MDIPGHLLANCLNRVGPQRLWRKLCDPCKNPVPVSEMVLVPGLEWPAADLPEMVYEAKGCGACLKTGYKGRLGIFETLNMNAPLRSAIASGEDHGALLNLATQNGLKTLTHQAMNLVLNGKTALSEVIREVVR